MSLGMATLIAVSLSITTKVETSSTLMTSLLRAAWRWIGGRHINGGASPTRQIRWSWYRPLQELWAPRRRIGLCVIAESA